MTKQKQKMLRDAARIVDQATIEFEVELVKRFGEELVNNSGIRLELYFGLQIKIKQLISSIIQAHK